MPSSPEAASIVAAYVRALRRRASLLLVVRGACAACGCIAILLVFAAAFAGPVVAPAAARGALALLVLVGLAVLVATLWPLRELRGARACRLLADADPALASRARSALELHVAAGPHVSPALVAAHAGGLRDALARVPVAQVVPLRALRHPMVYLGLGAVAWSGLLLGSSAELQSGLGALVQPARVQDDGLRIARVVGHLEARIVYPSYLGMDAAVQTDPVELSVPRGSTIELTVTPRIEARQAVLRVGESAMRMQRLENGQLAARFVAREDAPLQLRLRDGAQWYADDRSRRVHVIGDRAPEVRIESPADGSVVKLHDVVEVRFAARDDHGLTSLDLRVRLPNGEEERRRLWSSVSSDGEPLQLADATALVPAELGVTHGDVLLLWLEARDADIVSGPNVAASNTVSLEVASSAQTFSMHLPRLREALDGLLDLLADRIEFPMPDDVPVARQRFGELSGKTQAWLDRLEALLHEARRESEQPLLDLDQLEGVAERTRREHRRERSAYTDDANAGRWPQIDARLVEEHEKDVLLLADMFAQALVDEARVLTQELSALKDEMRALLEELKRADTPEARRALLSEIAKVQRRLRELAQSLSRLAQRVPSEFINREAIPQGSARSSAEDLKAAIEAGDLEAAERHLEQLESQIDELAQHIDGGGARFREARFGARDQALGEARQRLSMLAEEQERLAGRTREVVQRATQRSQSRQQGPLELSELSELAERVERDLRSIDSGGVNDFESRLLDRAQNRMRDAADALKTGDVAEAGRMTSAASRDLEQAAASLEDDARRFPQHPSTVDNARAAGDAARNLRKLEQRIGAATPALRDFVGPGEQQQMQGDVEPQREAQQAARDLQRELGPQGGEPPLSPGGQESMREVDRAMERARRALERGDPQEAALAQEDASDRLRQAEEQLARRGQPPRPREGGRRDEGEGGGRVDGPVRIPGADEFSGPVEMRRRLLDAMREQPPAGYEDAVERYYRELLR